VRRRGVRNRRGGNEDGASAVEFALVVPVLLLLVFGIVDYGLWFNESLNVRQGVREAARAGIAQQFDQPGCAGTEMEKLVCKTKAEIAPIVGQAHVRVIVPAGGWTRGAPLTVCGLVDVDGLTGVAPLPSTAVRSSTHMSIESTRTPTIAAGAYGDPAPGGTDWTWCA
jgi:hypothetical protein